MNTLIYMWLQPVIMNHQPTNERVYFDCILEGEHQIEDDDDLEQLVSGEWLSTMMEIADISVNGDFGYISVSLTNLDSTVEITDSPKVKKQKGNLQKFISSDKPLVLNKSNIDIDEKGQIVVKIAPFGITEKLDFKKIWSQIQKNVIGKIKVGDTLDIKDEKGNSLFELIGGSYLSLVGADITIRDKKNNMQGGIYIREDGRIDIGDFERTFMLSMNLNRLIEASIRNNKSLEDFDIKLLENNEQKNDVNSI